MIFRLLAGLLLASFTAGSALAAESIPDQYPASLRYSKPVEVIPGHGHPTNMAQVRRYTYDYLVYLRGKIGAHLEAGGDLKDAYYVDQSSYAHLDTFEELATRNAGRVFEQLEFE